MPSDSGTPAPWPDDAGVPSEITSSSAANNSERTDEPQQEPRNVAFGSLPRAHEQRRLELLDAAVGYAQMGWRIIPLCWTEDDGSCGYSGHNKREKCTSAGKRAILDDWPNRATSDPVIAAQWWRQPSAPLDTEEWYPLASIGLVLGEDSGVFALDVDPEHGGLERLEAQPQLQGGVHRLGGHGRGRGAGRARVDPGAPAQRQRRPARRAHRQRRGTPDPAAQPVHRERP